MLLVRLRMAVQGRLIAVLSGHIHSAQNIRLHGTFVRGRPGERVPYPLHGAMLYVVDAGCYGGFRLLTFEPTGGEEKGSPNSKL